MSTETFGIAIIAGALIIWASFSAFMVLSIRDGSDASVADLGNDTRPSVWSRCKRRVRWVFNCLETAFQPLEQPDFENRVAWVLQWLTKALGPIDDAPPEVQFVNSNSTTDPLQDSTELPFEQLNRLGAFEVIRTTFSAKTSDYNWNWVTDTTLQTQVSFYRSINLEVTGIKITASAEMINGASVVRLKTTWPDPDFRMSIFEETVSEEQKIFLGMQDIVVNDPDSESSQVLASEFGKSFDATYVIQSNDERVLKGLLTNEVQRDLLGLGADIGLNVLGGSATFEIRQEFESPHDGREICRLISRFANLLTNLKNADSSLMFQELGVSTCETFNCLVCGEEIEEAPVYCRACQTPHHADCWQYLGKCSTYGCGELWCDR